MDSLMLSRTCKVCEEKDKRLSDLLDQLDYMRKLHSPPQNHMIYETMEANAILSGSQDIIEYPNSDKLKEDERVLAEANSILMGTYS